MVNQRWKGNGIATTPIPYSIPSSCRRNKPRGYWGGGNYLQADDSSDIGSLGLHCYHLAYNAMLFFMESSKIFKNIITSWTYWTIWMYRAQDSQVELHWSEKKNLNIHKYQDLKSRLQFAPGVLAFESENMFSALFWKYGNKTLPLEVPRDGLLSPLKWGPWSLLQLPGVLQVGLVWQNMREGILFLPKLLFQKFCKHLRHIYSNNLHAILRCFSTTRSGA